MFVFVNGIWKVIFVYAVVCCDTSPLPPPPHPNINVSHSLSSPSFLILFELFLMNVLFSTRSICRFLLTSHFVFASLIFAHSCPSFRLLPFFFFFEKGCNFQHICMPTHNRRGCLFNFIDSLIIRYPHFSVYFHSPHTHAHTHAHASISVKSPPVPLRESPPARTHPFPLPSNHH